MALELSTKWITSWSAKTPGSERYGAAAAAISSWPTYNRVAIPLKGGAWREVSMHLLVEALAEAPVETAPAEAPARALSEGGAGPGSGFGSIWAHAGAVRRRFASSAPMRRPKPILHDYQRESSQCGAGGCDAAGGLDMTRAGNETAGERRSSLARVGFVSDNV